MMAFNINRHFFVNNKTFAYALLIAYIVVYIIFLTCFVPNFNLEEEDGESSKIVIPEFMETEQSDYDWRWTWICINNSCSRQACVSGKQISLQKCNMLCFKPQLWPMPKKVFLYEKKYVSFAIHQLYVKSKVQQPARRMLRAAYGYFVKNVAGLIRDPVKSANIRRVNVNVIISDHTTATLKLDTEESYTLIIKNVGANTIARITANNYFGARHALETLSQLIWFDNVDRTLNIITDIYIEDKPSFPYRGLMLDTARNYFPVQLLLKIIDGMAANKLNTFHWHLTDSHSFPFSSKSYPDLAKYGSYEPTKVYSINDIKNIIEYGKLHGIRVILEVDAPSHVLSGWREINTSTPLIFPDEANLNGQLNPNNPEALNILKNIYYDILQLTGDDLFHIGGDEVTFDTWLNLNNIDERAALNYWAFYMHKIISVLTSANGGKPVKKIILWSSKLTNSQQIRRLLNPNITTIVQNWYGYVNSSFMKELNLKLILSHVNSWYLDCGFGAWQEGRAPACSPYRTWQHMYKTNPWRRLMYQVTVLGGEVCMWTEQVGEDSLETRVWPRSAAFAERVWSNPYVQHNIIPLHTYTRLDSQRERMSRRNIKSEVLWPRYCTLNPGKC
ncbi:hypothetical protein Trydic_g9948 [Trypoxylus dichotomus]